MAYEASEIMTAAALQYSTSELKKIKTIIDKKSFDPVIPDYIGMEEYIQNGGYELYSQIKEGKIEKESLVE